MEEVAGAFLTPCSSGAAFYGELLLIDPRSGKQRLLSLACAGRRQAGALAFLLALSLGAGQQAAQAQPGRYLIAQAAERGGQGEGAWQLLREPMELPGLPAPTGFQYKSGLMYPNKKGGPSIGMRYVTQQDPSTAASRYREALRDSQWNVRPAVSGSKGLVISASKGKNSCQITVSGSNDPAFPTMIYISYQMGR